MEATLAAGLELARALAGAGRPREAAEVASRVAALRVKTLGRAHPVTRSTRTFLSRLLREEEPPTRVDGVTQTEDAEEEAAAWEVARAVCHLDELRPVRHAKHWCYEGTSLDRAETALDYARDILKRIEALAHPNRRPSPKPAWHPPRPTVFKMMRIVRKDASDVVVETLAGPAELCEGFLGARKKFGDLRFSRCLEPGERLELVVDNVVKLAHPAAKPKKRKKEKENDSPKNSATKDDDESEEPLPPPPPESEEPSADAKSEEPLPPPKRRLKKKKIDDESKSRLKKKKTKLADDESEAEWDPDKEEEEEDPAVAVASGGEWNAFAVSSETPTDPGGDEWNPVVEDARCDVVRVTRALSASELADRFHARGLLLLDSVAMPVAQLKKKFQTVYDAKLEEATARGLASTKTPWRLAKGNEETIPGFNQRPGGRVDMIFDNNEFDGVAWPWAPVVKEILGTPNLNYVGCVVARPGDVDQNWHVDGVHVDSARHQPADRLIVFCPLIDLTFETGCTELVPGSHKVSRLSHKFEAVAHLPRARHYVAAGTPLIMDYRLWHRGLANTSKTTLRPILYTVYQRTHHKRDLEDAAGDLSKFY
ncbi:hypothetical protein CTAYLR_004954 [Chrysophaeum taylorii]|uniref:Uncharacterized protein n=1 Tax=Chrysophaeum taylorii TaxID=2483200 RepID=A0AAD7XQX6_9STRA|nr:hypothetical protein CTAYLR_004954 [Chrysophaeum taylorii]